MILSKQNLEIYSVPQTDKGIPVLNNVHVTTDGASLAANSKSFICVSPVNETIQRSLPLDDMDREVGEFSISIGLAKEICNAMPADNTFGGLTEHTAVSRAMDKNYNDTGELNFDTTDGKRKKSLLGKKFERAYIEYKNFLRKIFSRQPRKAKLILNRKRLITLLGTIEKLCADKTGHSLVFVEVTQENEIILRSLNPRTGQHVAAYMSSYSQQEEQWIENSEWESKYVDIAKIKK
jgi:hypothetical protein